MLEYHGHMTIKSLSMSYKNTIDLQLESFINLRNRGFVINILVADIMHGLEPQTKEWIELLRQINTNFVVALNKVDLLNEWQPSPHTEIITTLNC